MIPLASCIFRAFSSYFLALFSWSLRFKFLFFNFGDLWHPGDPGNFLNSREDP